MAPHDQILAADIVTADGKLLHVTKDQHADLFWAIRGAGSYFGVIVQLKLQLYPALSHIYGGLLAWEAEHLETVLTYHFNQIEKFPQEFWAILFYSTPPDFKGKTILMGSFTYLGSEEKGKELIDNYRKVVTPFLDQVSYIPYAYGSQQIILKMFTPASYYQRARTLKENPTTAYLKELVEILKTKPTSTNWVSEDWRGVSQKDSKFSCFPQRKINCVHFFMSIYPPIPLDSSQKEIQKK